MKNDWQELTRITRGEPFTVERARLSGSGVAIEGSFELPPLARLTAEAFLRSHGSIKEMEQLFGVSYPTIKNRLSAIAAKLEFVEVNPPASRLEILERLDRGEITAVEATKMLGERT
jgi:hypothetical protein